MRLAKEIGVKYLAVMTNSQLVVGQVKSKFQTKYFELVKYLQIVIQLSNVF